MYRLFRQRVLRWQLLLVLAEFILLVASVYLAVVLRYWGDADTQSLFGRALHWRAPLIAIVLILSMAALGLYEVHLRAGLLGRLSRLGVAFVLGGIVLSVLYYVIPPAYLGRGVLGIALVSGYIIVALWRMVFLGFVDADLFKRRVVVLGAGKRAAEVIHEMRRKTDQRGFKVVGYVPIGTDPVAIPAPLLLHPDGTLSEWAARLDVDEIVVGPDDRRDTLPVAGLLECKQRGMAVTELTEFFEREAGMIKRAFDVTVASLVLLVAWPFILLTALAVRLESGRGAPILYRQERVGENGKPFQIIKFRSMSTDAEGDGVARWAS